jgi:hypothetical protein
MTAHDDLINVLLRVLAAKPIPNKHAKIDNKGHKIPATFLEFLNVASLPFH